VGDIRTIWFPGSTTGDWNIIRSLLESGSDLETSVLNSLFTNRQAGLDDVIPDGTEDPGGWWANPAMGSKLWLLKRTKLSPQTAQRAKDYVAEALQGLIDDGVAASIDITPNVVVPDRLEIGIVIHRKSAPDVALNYGWVWSTVN
jgi:phage gp46-like protein